MNKKNRKQFKQFMKSHRAWELYKESIKFTPLRTHKYALSISTITQVLDYYRLTENDIEYWADLNSLWLDYVN